MRKSTEILIEQWIAGATLEELLMKKAEVTAVFGAVDITHREYWQDPVLSLLNSAILRQENCLSIAAYKAQQSQICSDEFMAKVNSWVVTFQRYTTPLHQK